MAVQIRLKLILLLKKSWSIRWRNSILKSVIFLPVLKLLNLNLRLWKLSLIVFLSMFWRLILCYVVMIRGFGIWIWWGWLLGVDIWISILLRSNIVLIYSQIGYHNLLHSLLHILYSQGYYIHLQSHCIVYHLNIYLFDEEKLMLSLNLRVTIV